jgi:23S rRNA pseudouridine955/2504/2580 synthase
VQLLEVDAERAGQRLDQFLIKLLPTVPRSRIYRIVRRGEVRVNGGRAAPELRLRQNDKVRVPPIRVEPGADAPRKPSHSALERIQSAIVSEDERVIVLDKPSGIAVHGGSGLSYGVIEALRALRPEETLELVHRLDRDTSGCLLVARKRSALRTLHELLREGRFEKRYLTLVKGPWDLGHKRVDVPLRTDTRVGGERTVRASPGGKTAVSEFRPVQFFGPRATLLEVAIHTGRTHQIRVHAAYAGHPVAGDEKYGDEEFNEAMRTLGLTRMFLHAHSVSFDWPQGTTFSASAPLPAELKAVLDRLDASRHRKSRGSQRARKPDQRKTDQRRRV